MLLVTVDDDVDICDDGCAGSDGCDVADAGDDDAVV